MKPAPTLRLRALGLLTAVVSAVLAACGSSPMPPQPVAGARPQPAPEVAVLPPQGNPEVTVTPTRPSQAPTPRAYRADAARHLYNVNKDRIYKGRLPPLLYAIGVTQVEVDRNGHVDKITWMRAPSHAPEVVKEIERTVRAAAPFPVPARMGKVVYTDTWLWHKNGRFQLDTLTEGQD